MLHRRRTLERYFPEIFWIRDFYFELNESDFVGGYGLNTEGAEKKAEDKLGKATKDSSKIVTEVLHGVMTQFVKKKLFNEHYKPDEKATQNTAQRRSLEEVPEGAEPSKNTL